MSNSMNWVIYLVSMMLYLGQSAFALPQTVIGMDIYHGVHMDG